MNGQKFVFAHEKTSTVRLQLPARIVGRARGFRRAEDGGLIILSLFFFIGMIIAGGLAVDLMRFETARVINQATMDRAVLAAAGLDQELDPRDVVIDYYTKAGKQPPAREDIVVAESYVGGVLDADGNPIPGQEGELVSRMVSLQSPVVSPNYFTRVWDYSDVSEFRTMAASAALERIQNVEISLVVDISGSMGSNRRLINLKSAANEFIETVVDETRTEGITSVSIIPYHGNVVTGPLIDYLNPENNVVAVANPPAHPGAITSYNTSHEYSSCVRFDDDDFDTVVIGAGTPLERKAHFKENGNSYNQPSMNQRWCNENRPAILLHSTSVAQLKNHINSLNANGWTAVDLGIKWGAALLDPAMRPVMAEMIEDGLISQRAENRPNEYAPTETMKVLVIMTDGENTVQRDLKQQYKNGPSRIWHSHDAWSTPQGCFDASANQLPWVTSCRSARYDGQLGRNLSWRDGFFVEMPNRSTSQRWFRPGHWNTSNDNRFYHADTLASLPDARQLDYITLHNRFAVRDIGDFFFNGADDTERNRHRNAVEQFTGYSAADQRQRDICDAVKAQPGVLVFTLAFEAPDGAKEVMKYCATGGANGGFYYETDGTGISDAFRSIAGQITQLRLTL